MGGRLLILCHYEHALQTFNKWSGFLGPFCTLPSLSQYDGFYGLFLRIFELSKFLTGIWATLCYFVHLGHICIIWRYSWLNCTSLLDLCGTMASLSESNALRRRPCTTMIHDAGSCAGRQAEGPAVVAHKLRRYWQHAIAEPSFGDDCAG